MQSFNKIIGYETIKKELYQVIDIFKNKEKYVKMGAKLPNGLLIYGEPGLGKTMLAKAVIEECNVKTYYINNTLFKNELIKQINTSFLNASKDEKAIVFLDDMDKYCEENEECYDSRVFVSIQTNIDSVKDKDVLVIATVNNAKKLPESLVRSGRFDRQINVERPSNQDAAKIIKYYLKDKNVSDNLNLEDVSRMINYKSCADLEKIINESSIYAAYEGKDKIDIEDITKAYVRNEYDLCDDEYQCSEEEVEKTALHEAGHVVVAEALKEGSVGFVTIKPANEDMMRGFTNIYNRLKRRPENVLVGLGGKVACEQFYEGRCASGCLSDLMKVSAMIKQGIDMNGTMGIGLLSVSGEHDAYSDNAIRTEIERHMFMVKDILIKNKDFLLSIAKELAKKRQLYYSDIRRIREANKLVPFTLF